jgi:hypothetical protein
MNMLLFVQIYAFVILLLWMVKWFFGRDTEVLILMASLAMVLLTCYDLVLSLDTVAKGHP